MTTNSSNRRDFWKLIRKARHIARTLGYYRAARYLAARNVSLEGARYILLGR